MKGFFSLWIMLILSLLIVFNYGGCNDIDELMLYEIISWGKVYCLVGVIWGLGYGLWFIFMLVIIELGGIGVGLVWLIELKVVENGNLYVGILEVWKVGKWDIFDWLLWWRISY